MSLWPFLRQSVMSLWPFLCQSVMSLWPFLHQSVMSLWPFLCQSVMSLWPFLRQSVMSPWPFLRQSVLSTWPFLCQSVMLMCPQEELSKFVNDLIVMDASSKLTKTDRQVNTDDLIIGALEEAFHRTVCLLLFVLSFKEKVLHRSHYVCLSISTSFCHENLTLAITAISKKTFLSNFKIILLLTTWHNYAKFFRSRTHLPELCISSGNVLGYFLFSNFIYRSPQRQLNKSIEVNLFKC